FSRTRRLEVSGGVHAISFDRSVTTSVFDGTNGLLMQEQSASARGAPSIMLGDVGAALVYDSAVLGPTSPVLGQRYRIDVAPHAGDLTFTTVTADFRPYLIPIRPLTMALRAQHVGRHGPGAGAVRVVPRFW